MLLRLTRASSILEPTRVVGSKLVLGIELWAFWIEGGASVQKSDLPASAGFSALWARYAGVRSCGGCCLLMPMLTGSVSRSTRIIRADTLVRAWVSAWRRYRYRAGGPQRRCLFLRCRGRRAVTRMPGHADGVWCSFPSWS